MKRVLAALCAVLAASLPAAAGESTGIVAAARSILSAARPVDAEPSARPLRLIAWRSKDTSFPADQRARVRRIMEHIRNFYASEMERNGFGRIAFPLEYDAAGELVLREAVGAGGAGEYKEDGPSGDRIRQDCWAVLRAAGLDPDRETVVIFTNLADWDPVALTFSHHSPYMGTGSARGGIAWQLDHAGLDATNLVRTTPVLRDAQYGTISLGRHNSIFLGGIAHELGHALGLPHERETEEEHRLRGATLMGDGNRSYGEEVRGEGKGSFLSLASAMRLASHPLFTGARRVVGRPPRVDFRGLAVRADARAFTVSGSVTSAVPVYAVVAYLDPEGEDDYDARTAVAVPAFDGAFSIDCRALVPGRSAELRLVACLANGDTAQQSFGYRVRRDGTPDVSAMEMPLALHEFLAALERSYPVAVKVRDALPADSRARRLASAVLESRWNRAPTNEAAGIAARLRGRPVRLLSVPTALLAWAGRVNAARARLFGAVPMLTPGKVRELGHPDWVCDNAPFSAATGWRPEVEFPEGLRRTLAPGTPEGGA